MKKYIYKLSLILLLVSATACKEELLDLKNPNALITEQFWITEADAEQGVNAMYAMFYKPGLWSRWMYFRLDLTSDEGYSISPWVELADWTRFQYINYNFGEGNGFTWADTYAAIWRTNQVLDNVPNIEFQDENKKQQLLAQAKFMRAFHYYYAAIIWENVPLVLESPEPDDLAPQNTLEEVWAQVEKDLSEAAAVLPGAWNDANVGRPTRGAALAYLAKAQMQQHKWEQAKISLDYHVVGEGMGFYDLVPNFQDNFTHVNQNNKESVFEIQFSAANIGGGDGNDPNANMGSNRAQFFAPRGIGWSDGQARFWIVDEFKKENTITGGIDPRLQYSLFYPQLEEDFGNKVYGRSWEWEMNEAWFKKYSRDYYRGNEDYFSEVNLRLVRFADILLMYAEVLNELGQTADAYQYVDRVRARANMAPLATAYPEIGNDQAMFLDRLKTERVLELVGESVRWADLKRWGDLDTPEKVAVVAQRDPDFNNFEVGKHIRMPIPQIEVLNNPNLDQNPGY